MLVAGVVFTRITLAAEMVSICGERLEYGYVTVIVTIPPSLSWFGVPVKAVHRPLSSTVSKLVLLLLNVNAAVGLNGKPSEPVRVAVNCKVAD